MTRIQTVLTGLVLMLVLAGSGCNRPFASMEREFDAACWDLKDTLDLRFDNKDTSQVYQMWFPLTLTEDYGYSNIYLHAELTPPSGETTVLPASFPLMGADGAWAGESQGKTVKFDLLMAGAIRLNQTGSYRIRCYQYMRDSVLCGVQSAGITLDVRKADSTAQ